MKALIYVLAGIGTLTVSAISIVVFFAVLARRAEKRRYSGRPPRTSWAKRRARNHCDRRIQAHRLRLLRGQVAARQLGVPEPEFDAIVQSLRSGKEVPPC